MRNETDITEKISDNEAIRKFEGNLDAAIFFTDRLGPLEGRSYLNRAYRNVQTYLFLSGEAARELGDPKYIKSVVVASNKAKKIMNSYRQK